MFFVVEDKKCGVKYENANSYFLNYLTRKLPLLISEDILPKYFISIYRLWIRIHIFKKLGSRSGFTKGSIEKNKQTNRKIEIRQTNKQQERCKNRQCTK